MNPKLNAARAGLQRGLLEFRQMLTTGADLTYTIVINGILLAVVYFQRGSTIDGAGHSLAAATLPGLLGMTITVAGLMGVATLLATDREDGTLLRAKATPHGLFGYLIARVVLHSCNTLLALAILVVGGLALLGQLAPDTLSGWFTLSWVLILGLLATLPWGAVIGSLVKSSSSSFSLTFLPIAGMATISGVFYPISALPGWLHPIAQVFPMYWVGLGTRSAFLPPDAAVVEIAGTWRPVATVLVLGIWAVAGLVLAPRVLAGMARRESGSLIQLRKQQVLQRGY